MHVLFEGSPRAVDAQLRALGGEESDPWDELRALQARLPGRVRWDGEPRRSSGPGPRVAYVEERARAGVEPARRAGAGGAVQPELIADCVHCGFCLPTCPTYSLWHEEMDSPRGRIYLMQGLVDGTIALTDTVVEHFDRCLGCMACVTACPSGVQYDRLIEQTRDARRGATTARGRSSASCARRSSPCSRTGVGCVRRSRFRGCRRPGPLAPLKQIAPPWAAPEWPPEHLPGDGPSVALVAGCVASVVFGDVNAATARVLHAEATTCTCRARRAAAARCTRTPAGSTEGVARARTLERALDGYDYIVTNAAGCGSHLKDHGVANVVDVSELLGEPRAERHPLPLRVAFQDSCHLRHAQGVADAPRAMLDAIPGLERLEPAEQEICCGSAGIYNIVQPADRGGARRPQGRERARDRRRTRTRAAIPAASCRSRRRCAARAGRCRRSIRSSSWTRRSAGSTQARFSQGRAARAAAPSRAGPDLAGGAPHLPHAVALHEPVLAIETDRRLVVREHAQRQLVQSVRAAPFDRRRHERRADAAAALLAGDHHPDLAERREPLGGR